MKRLVVILMFVLLLCGCDKKIKQSDEVKRLYLSDKYYNNGEFINVSDLSKLDQDTYVLFTYNNFCNFEISCDKIFESFMKKYKIDFLKIPFNNFKDTIFYETVKYAPSILIVSDNKIVGYLDANDDMDLDKYQDEKSFEMWMDKYIYFENGK